MLSTPLLPPFNFLSARESSPSPEPPSATAKRRVKHSSRTPNRRRLERSPDFFERLPWITAMDAPPPDHLSPWDIADLSQLIPPEHSFSDRDASGPGPIRRRKTSLRSSPLAAPSTSPAPLPPCHSQAAVISLPNRSSVALPHTPSMARFSCPTRVIFRHLMPVFIESVADPCASPGFIRS